MHKLKLEFLLDLLDFYQFLGGTNDEILSDSEGEEKNNKTTEEVVSKCDKENRQIELSTNPNKKDVKQASSSKSSSMKKLKQDPRIDEVYNILKKTVSETPNERDENDVFGEYVTKTLRALDNHSRIVAKHYINQTLFDAEIGRFKQPSLYMQSSLQHQYSNSASASSSTTVTPFPSPSPSSSTAMFSKNQHYQDHISSNENVLPTIQQLTPMQPAAMQEPEQVPAMATTDGQFNCSQYEKNSLAPKLLPFINDFK